MNLLTCIDCGGTVSVRAESCPHCGCPVEITRGAQGVSVSETGGKSGGKADVATASATKMQDPKPAGT